VFRKEENRIGCSLSRYIGFPAWTHTQVSLRKANVTFCSCTTIANAAHSWLEMQVDVFGDERDMDRTPEGNSHPPG